MNFSPSSSSGSAALSAMTGIPGNMLVVFCVIIIERKIRFGSGYRVVGGGKDLMLFDFHTFYPILNPTLPL